MSIMQSLIVLMVCLMLLNECNYADGDIGTISGYPQVDVRELNALTLSWNQVNYGINIYILHLNHNTHTTYITKLVIYRLIGSLLG